MLTAAQRQLQLEEALQACIPWVATNGRGAAQEALAIACDLVGWNPYDWTSHPETLTTRRSLLGLPDRRQGPQPERRRA